MYVIGDVMRFLSFLILFRMSKNNRLRAKINRTAINNHHYRIIHVFKHLMWIEDYLVSRHYRSFKTWKHNRKQQFKNK